MDYQSDIVVIGAGPAGLSFAREFADNPLKIIIVEQLPQSVLENPPFDAREIALTHLSREIMQNLGIWQQVPEDQIFRLKEHRHKKRQYIGSCMNMR